jgi:hypothetical protein
MEQDLRFVRNDLFTRPRNENDTTFVDLSSTPDRPFPPFVSPRVSQDLVTPAMVTKVRTALFQRMNKCEESPPEEVSHVYGMLTAKSDADRQQARRWVQDAVTGYGGENLVDQFIEQITTSVVRQAKRKLKSETKPSAK